MTKPETALREFCDRWSQEWNENTGWYKSQIMYDKMLPDLTALISEHYVSREDAGYPLEFIEWLIKDQEIFFGELNEEYILNDNIHVGGRKLQTIDELFAYWKDNEC